MGEKLITLVATVAVVIMGPYLLTCIINGRQIQTSLLENVDTGKDVIIQINGENMLIDVEKYIAGVLPGVVDWTADATLIEAQAVAVRAKIYYAMGEDSLIQASNLEYTYYTKQEIIEKLGDENGSRAQTIYEKAVYNTKGIIE